MESKLQTITPAMAQKMLDDGNVNNRKLSVRRAKVLGDAILRGEWKINGDSIRFSETGRLLDGQHRLTAVVISGEPIETIVVTGLDENSFDTIDTGGRARTQGDILYTHGVKNANAVASVVSKAFRWKNNGNPVFGSPEAKPTISQTRDFYTQNKSIIDKSVEVCQGKWLRKYGPLSVIAFVCFAIIKSDGEEDALNFMYGLETGACSNEKSPVLMLRDRLMEAKLDKKVNMSEKYKIALIFKAYKLHKKGSTVKTLKVRTEGYSVEKGIFEL